MEEMVMWDEMENFFSDEVFSPKVFYRWNGKLIVNDLQTEEMNGLIVYFHEINFFHGLVTYLLLLLRNFQLAAIVFPSHL